MRDKIKILLVEDNPGDVDLLKEKFRGHDYEFEFIAVANSLTDVRQKVDQEEPHLILLDLNIKGSRGEETFRHVYEMRPEVPIVILSGYKDDEFALRMIRQGAEDYVVKGEFSEKAMTRIIRYAIERKKLHDERYVAVHEKEVAEQRLKFITDALPGAVYQYQLRPDKTQSFLFMSEGIRDLLDVDAEYAVKNFNSIWKTIHPDDEQRVWESILKSAESLSEWQCDFRSILPDGEIKWIRGHSIPEPPLEDGSIVYNGILLDITSERLVREKIEENERLYRQILDAISDMVLVKKRGSKIYWANKAFREYYGMSNEQLQDIIDSPVSHPDYTAQYLKDDQKVFDTGRILDIPEEPVTRHDGEVRYFHTIKTPIFDEKGRVNMIVGVSRDNTEDKKREEELKRTLADLKDYKKVTIGRELMMVDLKKKVNAYCEKLGRSPEFDLSGLQDEEVRPK